MLTFEHYSQKFGKVTYKIDPSEEEQEDAYAVLVQSRTCCTCYIPPPENNTKATFVDDAAMN